MDIAIITGASSGLGAEFAREVSQTVKSTVVTTNCEKSAEAVIGKALKWTLLKGRTM